MKIGTYTQLRIVCILGLAASFGLTGCKVGSFKMPKMSWNREPSATTLAGSETPKLPESPANKYTPSTIASVGAGTSPGTSSGYKAPSNGYAGQTSSTNTPNATGLAASANGYQTGPYTVGTRPGATGSQPNSGTPSNVAAGPNPYGGSYAGMTPAKPSDSSSQNGVKGALANYPAPSASTGYGSVPQTSGSAYTTGVAALPQLPPATTTNSYGATAPNSYSAPPPSNPYQNLPPIPSTSTIAAGTAPIGQTPQSNIPSYPGVPTQPTAGQTSVGSYTAGNSSVGSQPSNRYTGAYQPGTTSRSTTYNFGSVAPAQATAPAATGTQLPPNTASNPPVGVMR
jgi:hypothetical protein